MRFGVTVCNVPGMITHADLIAAKGAAEIAARLGVPPINVRMWKSRNTIPRSAWAELIDAYPEITLEVLKAANHAPANDATAQDRAA